MARTRIPSSRPVPFRDAKLFYIVCGGNKTEVIYFERVKKLVHSSKLSLLIVSPVNDQCDPKRLVERAKAQSSSIDSDDEYWVVFDIDHNLKPQHIGNLKSAIVLANQSSSNIYMAISNPCFEVWLIFHSDYVLRSGIPSTAYEKEARLVFGSYNKSNLDNIPFENLTKAIRAAKANRNGEHPWPGDFGSDVFKIFESLKRTDRSLNFDID